MGPQASLIEVPERTDGYGGADNPTGSFMNDSRNFEGGLTIDNGNESLSGGGDKDKQKAPEKRKDNGPDPLSREALGFSGTPSPSPVEAPIHQWTLQEAKAAKAKANAIGFSAISNLFLLAIPEEKLLAPLGKVGKAIIRAFSKTKLASAIADGAHYSVAFETQLTSTLYPGKYYYTHFKAANEALSQAIAGDGTFAASMENLSISVPRSSAGTILGKSPANYVRHHDIGAGIMQLVPAEQHTAGSIFWDVLHPNGMGGMAIWGK